MIDGLESFLAQLIGRSSWPSTIATYESQLAIPSGLPVRSSVFSDSTTSRYLLYSYEVDGTIYSAALRATAESLDRSPAPPEKVTIQYDPLQPKRIYYAPACRLANHAIFGVAIVGGILITFLMKN